MMAPGDSPVRVRRLQSGLTQAELAQRAAVSRQLIAAVEARQNTPAVDAALRIAHALATTVEELFGVPPQPVAPALGGPLRDGAPVRVGRVGEQLVAAALPDHGTAGDGWGIPDGVLHGNRLALFEGASVDRFVLAGCDPALGVTEAMLAGLGPRSVLALSAPTGTAIRSLGGNLVHAAAVHGPPAQLPAPPRPVTRVHLAAWQVGLGVAPELELGLGSLEELLDRGVPIVQRDPGAASQQALERACTRTGRPVAAGPRAGGHIDAARQAAIRGCAGVTTEATARAFELTFIPLEEHTVEIWIAGEWVHHPAVESLGNLLASSAFTARLAAFSGYDLANTGARVAPH
jgi:DNA-binding XRE family transcriptional regulator/molybdate-binding protein